MEDSGAQMVSATSPLDATFGDTPVIGNNGPSDLVRRVLAGTLPLVVYGVVGTVEQAFVAPFYGQIPLVAGFTMDTPLSIPAQDYDLARLQDGTLQWDAHVAGQYAIPGIVRSHTTGILDYATAVGLPGAYEANELLHPGRHGDLHNRGATTDVKAGTVLPYAVTALSPVGISEEARPWLRNVRRVCDASNDLDTNAVIPLPGVIGSSVRKSAQPMARQPAK